MRILKKEKDSISVIPESINDLWFLFTRLGNMVVEQRTLRTKVVKKSGEILKGKKIPQILSIKVEKKKWETNRVRLTGKITSGSEKNKYHSLDLKVYSKIKIYGGLNNLPRPENYKILTCVVDKGEADFRIYDFIKLKDIKKVAAKGRETEYYKEIASALEKENMEIILAGPGKPKNLVAKLIDKEIIVDNLSNGGERGFKELLTRGCIKQVIGKFRDRKEKETVKKFLIEIKKQSDKVCYGSEVEKNKDKLNEILVLNSLVPKYEDTLEEYEKNGVKINVVNDDREYCKEIRQFEIIGLCWY